MFKSKPDLKHIVAEMKPDSVEPYKSAGLFIPYVIASNHPIYVVGCRLDYGYLRHALEAGYRVAILPREA